MSEFLSVNSEHLTPKNGTNCPVFVVEEYDSNNNYSLNKYINNEENIPSIRKSGSFSKKPLKHSNSVDNMSKYISGSPTEKKIKHGSVCSTTSGRIKNSMVKQTSREDTPDDISIGGCSIANITDFAVNNNSTETKQMTDRLVKFLSIMYALIIIVLGVIIALSDIDNPVNDLDHIFGITITVVGMVWVAFVHWDIQRHKRLVMIGINAEKLLIKENISNKSMATDMDAMSVTTAVLFSRPLSPTDPILNRHMSAYRFSEGKHSSNFYLKCGITIFCMGSIIHQGVSLAQQIHFFIDDENKCKNIPSLLVYFIRCISAFYYLYFSFKYSNLIISRCQVIARFALMHLVGSGISFWFSTILEEAIAGYVKKIKATKTSTNWTVAEDVFFKKAVEHSIYCDENSLSNTEAMDTLPYLYPFTIEFNIILASIWYMIWTNIGLNSKRETIIDEKQYKQSLVISADCHASNLGLFGGLLALLTLMTTTVIFFMTISQKEFNTIGINIFTAQSGLLTLFSAITIPLAYRKIRQLNFVGEHHMDNASTAMDDLLVLIPLPFYYVYNILAIRAEFEVLSTNSIILIVTYIVCIIQVTIQSPFLVDGIRRCANNKKLRFLKPGKGLVTFALILNIGFWILITFEIKSVDKYHMMQAFYGKFTWMIISDTCLPLILFYRFHSSVCLSDIWKHAYERDEHNSHLH